MVRPLTTTPRFNLFEELGQRNIQRLANPVNLLYGRVGVAVLDAADGFGSDSAARFGLTRQAPDHFGQLFLRVLRLVFSVAAGPKVSYRLPHRPKYVHLRPLRYCTGHKN